jgi:chorismate synthase
MARLRFLTAGESHGRALVAILEGAPAGLAVSLTSIAEELTRRRAGHGRGPRMRIETDQVEVVAGVRGGRTLGSPIAVVIHNAEWEKWAHVMPVEEQPAGNRLTRPRPGHADLVGMLKYGFDDARDVLERASARETAARVALGSIAKSLLKVVDIEVVSQVIQIGAVTSPRTLHEPEEAAAVDASPVRCLDREASDAMVREIDAASEQGDSLGGVIEVVAFGLPPGLGSHVHWDRRLDSRIAGALMSIPAIKGIELGNAFEIAAMPGSRAHDEIEPDMSRATLRAGGTEGGMTIGGMLRMRAAMKPLSTLKRRLRTVDIASGEPAEAFQERTDTCAVPAAGVVCESVLALVLADSVLEMFGGDTMNDLTDRYRRYLARIDERRPG